MADFITKFHEEVNKVIGGRDDNEILTLLLPGIALTKSDFEYNYINKEPKGPVIEANESRLANKLYNYAPLVNGDNGKTLEHQYKSALDMLTPKINPILANAKNKLRELLLKPYPYNFGSKIIKRAEYWDDNDKTNITNKSQEQPQKNDDTTTPTFQEVFFRLYNDYVEQLGEWATQRQLARDHFQKQSDRKGFTDPTKKNQWVEDQYLQWYEDNGEAWLAAVNQKMSVLLSVFSDNDMKIIEGILDSGSGAELQEARQILRNFRKINPDGGYIYPVKFNPTNWFDYLDTSFTPVDLVNSPAAIVNELTSLYNQRDYISQRIIDVSAQIPPTDTLTELQKKVDAAKNEYKECDRTLQNVVTSSFSDFAKFATKTICAACCPTAAIATEMGTDIAGKAIQTLGKESSIDKKDTDKNFTSPKDLVIEAFSKLNDTQKNPNDKKKIENEFSTITKGEDGSDIKVPNEKCTAFKSSLNIPEKINDGIDVLIEGTNRVNFAQQVYLNSINNYTNAMLESNEVKTEYKNLGNLVKTLRMEQISIENKIKVLEAKLRILKPDDIEKCFSEDVKPPAVPNGFTQLVINHSFSKSEQSTSTQTSSSTSSSTTGFWFFRKTTHSTTNSSSTQSFCNQEGSQIQIGMNIAKVGIERQWFNPGIFALTKEMYSVAEDEKLKISKGPNGGDSLNQCVFPCFPTAMVIARDVTIQLSTTQKMDYATASNISSECSSSKTFFVFNAGDSSSSHTSSAKSLASDDNYTVTMRFTTPQIIGFYQQIVPNDECTPYPKENSNRGVPEEVENNIVKFLQAYEKVIDGRLQKDNDKPKEQSTN